MKDIYEVTGNIRITTARLIASYLGISLWKEDWDELIDEQLPTSEDVQNFNRNRSYENMTCDQLEQGSDDGVNVATLIHYYRINVLKIQPFTRALSRYISEVKLSQENDMLVLYVAAILADSANQVVAERSHELLKKLKDSEFDARFEMRDILKELSYQGKEPVWLKSFLIEQARASKPVKSAEPKKAKD